MLEKDKKEQREFEDLLADLAKGIIAGGALGLLFGLTEIVPMIRAVGLGLMCGCLGGLSYGRVRRRGKKKLQNK
ncbi:MAG: hypothetical protein ACNI27_04615 [Desulfovibrio sp.]